MSAENSVLEENAGAMEWPYPVNYGKENEVTADVLVLGGGLSGCSAAISAARKGMKVAMVEKGCTIHSGCAGAGIDHWHEACTNPACQVTPEEYAQASIDCLNGYNCGIGIYIACRESYDTLLDLEKMGLKIRDTEDEFKGAPFRDEETKHIFAYDYKNRYCLAIWGTGLKTALWKECKRLGVDIYDRVTLTELLTEGGRQGTRVVGATGLGVRNGEFYIFKSRATIICTAGESRLWSFSSEKRSMYSSSQPPQMTGEGWSVAWKAGAEFSLFEKSMPLNLGGLAGSDIVHFVCGYWDSEWRPCTMVDATGKEVPWVDRDGNPLADATSRNMPSPGQKFFLPNLFVLPKGIPAATRELLRQYEEPNLKRGIRKLMAKGELVAPLYADLPSMPENERRKLFGLHLGQEGKTWIGYRMLTEAGFDPDKHLLQFYPVDISPRERSLFFNSGGLIPDWDLRTNLEGLYAAGEAILASSGAAHACTTGRYAGRKAAEYATGAREPLVNRKQVDREKIRVYAPVNRKDGIEWKEFNFGICQVMQVYCGAIRNEESLKLGLRWLNELKEQEATQLYARNPHELGRVLETLSIISVGELVIHSSLARKASSGWLNFQRSDYPDPDPPEWHKWVTVRLENNEVKAGEMPIDYWGPLKENYEAHCGL